MIGIIGGYHDPPHPPRILENQMEQTEDEMETVVEGDIPVSMSLSVFFSMWFLMARSQSTNPEIEMSASASNSIFLSM